MEPAAVMKRTHLSDFACLAVAALLLSPHVARAQHDREIAIGAAAHLIAASSGSCTQDGDVTECSAGPEPFAGADLNINYWPNALLGIGARFAGSKDLDGSGGADSDGLSWDPVDQWLWRASAGARLDPPFGLGLWVSGEIGIAWLREVQESHSGSLIVEDGTTRTAPLLGLGAGWDFWLGSSLTLTPEVRAQLIVLGDAPELRPGAQAKDYGSTLWFELALRLSYVL